MRGSRGIEQRKREGEVRGREYHTARPNAQHHITHHIVRETDSKRDRQTETERDRETER